jgi:hypothetical protein
VEKPAPQRERSPWASEEEAQWEKRKPVHEDKLPGIVQLLGRRAAPVLAALWPDPVNKGEEDWLARNRSWLHPPQDLTFTPVGDHGVDIRFGPEAVLDIGRAPVPLAYSPSGNTLPEIGEEPAPWAPPVRLPEENVEEAPVPRPMPRPRPVDDVEYKPTRRPERRREREESPLVQFKLEFRLDEEEQPVMRIKGEPVPVRYLARKRIKDTKFGRKVFWVVNRAVDATYGLVSEAMDAAEVFAFSLYAPNGMSAMALEGGDLAKSFKGYMEGRYRLDVTGFVVDFGINQAEDFAYALADAPQEFAAKRMPGWDPTYTADRFRLNNHRKERSDVAQEWISWGSSHLRSFDSERRRRIRGLWSS